MAIYNDHETDQNIIDWNKEQIVSSLNNTDLKFDMDRLKNYDPPVVFSRVFDSNLEASFGIDVGGNGYWYAEKDQRNADFERLKLILTDRGY